MSFHNPAGDCQPQSGTGFLPLIGVLILTGLGLSVGFLLLFIPGVMLLVRWSVGVPACVLDRTGPVASLKRSATLTKGHRWKIFGMFLLLWIVSMVVAGLIIMVARPFGALAGAVAGFIWTALWSAYFNSVWVMLYHDLRVAKEGFDGGPIAAVFD